MNRLVNIRRETDIQDNVYYNCDIIDGKEIDEGVNSNPMATYNETRDTAIIKDSSKYLFSIIRFQMIGPGITLPLFIPIIEPEQDDINLSIYKIGMKTTVNYEIAGTPRIETFNNIEPIQFRSQSTTAPEPQVPLGRPQDFSSDYYYVQDYSHWVKLVNETYVKVWNNINNQFKNWWTAQGGAGSPNLNTKPPHMIYNANTKRFNIYTDKYGWGNTYDSKGTTSEEEFQMFFNSNMYGLYDSFPHEYEGGDLASKNESNVAGVAFEIKVIDNLGTNLYTDTSTAPPAIPPAPQDPPYTRYVITDQNWSSTDTLWSPIGSIVFISSLLPIMSESTGQPIKFGTGNNQQSGSSNGSAFQPIITDITLGDNAEAYKGKITYVPSGQYRFSSLSTSPADIRNIDIQVFWKNRLDGNLIPLRMFNKSSISIKILFKKIDNV